MTEPLLDPTPALFDGWALRVMAADLNALAAVLDELEAERWYLCRRLADVAWDSAARSRIEGRAEALGSVLDRLGATLE